MGERCVGMTANAIRAEIDRLVSEINGMQMRIGELSAKLIVTINKEEGDFDKWKEA